MAEDTFRQRVREDFGARYAVYWANLARLNNLLIVLNISFFFATELVTKEGYYYTYFSLLLTLGVYAGLLVPFGRTSRLGHYLVFLGMALGALYFFVVSVWYWVVTNKEAAREMLSALALNGKVASDVLSLMRW